MIVVGLGPGDLARVPSPILALLLEPDTTVVVRTLHHPAAAQLAERRSVVDCDDLYTSPTFAEVYTRIAERVAAAAERGPVVYAVPGSPLVGEFAVDEIKRLVSDVQVIPGESFVDLALSTVGVDPLRDGFQLLNGHELPFPLVIDKPTLVGHLDRPETLADVLDAVARLVDDDFEVTLLSGLGAEDENVVAAPPGEIDPSLAGFRTTLYVPPARVGLAGMVETMRILRSECPWDRRQTHATLARHLAEETAELLDALAVLPASADDDWGAYADVEEELGDVLLQVLFHAEIARTGDGGFDIDDVADQLRRKLERRHPHVFGDVDAADADTVKANWDEIKAEEKAERGVAPISALDGVPVSLSALPSAFDIQHRAAKVGFDWPDVDGVVDKVREELAEVLDADTPDALRAEVGDLLFSVVNLARRLDVDPDGALRAAIDRFRTRFMAMEAEGPLDGLPIDTLEARWQRAKADLEP